MSRGWLWPAMLIAMLLTYVSITTASRTDQATDWLQVISGAEERICAYQRRVVQTAVERYSLDHGRYPTNLDVLSPVYLDLPPLCPSGDRYRLTEHGLVTCPIHGP